MIGEISLTVLLMFFSLLNKRFSLYASIGLMVLFCSLIAFGQQSLFFPQMLLKDPYSLEQTLGKPSLAKASGSDQVRWSYHEAMTQDPEDNQEIQDLRAQFIFQKGHLVSYYITPLDSRVFSQQARDYIPADCVIEMIRYLAPGEFLEHPSAMIDIKFHNLYLEGRAKVLVDGFRYEELEPNGIYKKKNNFAALWSGKILSANLRFRPQWKALSAQSPPSPSLIKAISQTPRMPHYEP